MVAFPMRHSVHGRQESQKLILIVLYIQFLSGKRIWNLFSFYFFLPDHKIAQIDICAKTESLEQNNFFYV